MSRRSRVLSRRAAVTVSVASVMLATGVFLVRMTDAPAAPNAGQRDRGAAAAPPSTPPARSARAAGVPVRFASGRRGSVAAAVAYATASQRWLYFTDDQIAAAVAEIATTTAASGLTRDVVADVSMARNQLAQSSGRVWWLVRPLAWRVDTFRQREARVSVWTVTILSAAGVAAPQSEFVTVTLDLARVHREWRVDGVHDTPGPTPITGPHDQPWDAEPFDRALTGYARMDGEPVQ